MNLETNKLTPENDRDFLSTADVAKIFNRSANTVRRWVAQREIPSFQFKGSTYFLRHRLIEWAEEREVKPWQ